jgi:hypothetical protein
LLNPYLNIVKKKNSNAGFDPKVIEEYRSKMKLEGKLFFPVEEEGNSDEYFHFYFIGKFEGKEVIYDTVLYTLRLQHESELFEMAELKAAQHFPDYKKITYEEDENGDLKELDSVEEEIGLYMAEVIVELQEEEEVKVQEHIDIDEHAEFGVSLDVGLHVEKITPQVIEKFLKNYNEDTLQLDDTFYSFQAEDDENQ